MKALILQELKHSQLRVSKHLIEETEELSLITARARQLYKHTLEENLSLHE